MLGAAVTYWLDPSSGTRRRALARDALVRVKGSTTRGVVATRNDFAQRARGLWAEFGHRLSSEIPFDDVIVARVRSKLGAVCSHPAAVRVASNNGEVWLSGPILVGEVEHVVRTISHVRGVQSVKQDFEVHTDPGHVSALQGGTRRTGTRFELLQRHWSPSTRFIAAGAALGAIGYSSARRTSASLGFGLFGALVGLRALVDRPIAEIFGLPGNEASLSLIKTVHVNAPVEQVFALWRNPQTFPLFMEHVRYVTPTDDDAWLWEVAGPFNRPRTFASRATHVDPNKRILWESHAGGRLAMCGAAHFDEPPEGGTRVQLEIAYNPPGGVLGYALATLFGANPKRQLDDDMLRFKSLIESGSTTVKGHKVRRDTLLGSASAPAKAPD